MQYIPGKSATEQFTEAFNPYIQMMIAQKMKQKADAPAEARAKAGEERAQRKEAMDAIESISKGMSDIQSIPESIRSQILRPASVDTAGFKGSPEMQSKLQSLIAGGAKAQGPAFQGRITPAEQPQAAQQRLRTGYEQVQKAISPYKALQGGKWDLWQRALAGEKLGDNEKRLLGLMSKEDPNEMEMFNRLFGEETSKSPYKEYPDAFMEDGVWKVERDGKKYRIEE